MQYKARKVPKFRGFSGPYFPVFELNTGKYGPEKTPYLDTFHTVKSIQDTERIDLSRGNITKKIMRTGWMPLIAVCIR